MSLAPATTHVDAPQRNVRAGACLIVLLLSACGQTGPLTLEERAPGTTSNAPDSAETTDAEEAERAQDER